MEIVSKISELRENIKSARAAGKRIGFVPTMGYLHRGHLSLVDISTKHSEFQVMSIFVNRIQFNDRKDFETYPREFERDFEMARGAGVDMIFVPDENEMYKDRMTFVDVELLTEHLCGAHRPGHFRGVYTVVSKLFNIVQPDVSVFGQKDIQQVITIEKMAADLNFPIKIITGPIVRESDGLAMSSRNKRLSADQRKDSVAIYRSLKKAEEMINSGETGADKITEAMKAVINSGHPDKIDYISAVSYNRLQPVEAVTERSVIAVAAFFDSVRLIDNMIIEKSGGKYKCVY
jgi:pantoate--beta-alanine ligase